MAQTVVFAAARNGQASKRTVIVATIPIDVGEDLRVSLDYAGSPTTVDVRVFKAFTPAKVLMPTKVAIRVASGFLPELIAGLQAALVATAESVAING